jgi:hypothetical protein
MRRIRQHTPRQRPPQEQAEHTLPVPHLEHPPAPAFRRLDRVHALVRLRRRIAEQTRLLTERELAARLLRLDIATELRRNGSTKTEAETIAKAHPRYIAHERGTLELGFARALSEAEAEALVFELQGALDESMATTSTQLAAATLLAPWWAHATPPEQRALLADAVRLVGLLRGADPQRGGGSPAAGATPDRPRPAA